MTSSRGDPDRFPFDRFPFDRTVFRAHEIMSHIITVRTRLREREPLITALGQLGMHVREGEDLRVRGDSRTDETAEIVVDTGSTCDIGLRVEDDEYVVLADWYNIELATSIRRQDFLSELQQQYSYAVVCAQARAENLIIEEERTENGEITLVLSERG